MKLYLILPVIFTALIFYGCTSTKKLKIATPEKNIEVNKDTNAVQMNTPHHPNKNNKTDTFLAELLKKYPQYFDSILANRKAWNVQIIYTEVNRDADNRPHFKDYFFNVDSNQYYYPASTVKLPVVLLALQKLNELSNTGIRRNTTMITESAYSGQEPTYNDPQTPDGRPTIESYIKRILLVSDNDAFNRLYEFLGPSYINDELHKKGYQSAEIIHRLDVSLTEDENRHTNPLKFLDSNDDILYSQPMQYNTEPYPVRHDSLGTAYMQDGKITDNPMNFSKKNRLCLEDLHYILRSAIFPQYVPARQRFNVVDSDYSFIHQYMSEYPSESVYPGYDTSEYQDAFVKFLLYGAQKGSLPKNIRIFNKVGDAYGELIDAAYIVDFDHNIEFFLSAAINCNINNIVNDDNYAYDSIGFPFMKHLGEVIYQYDLSRKRKYRPDLSDFRMNYDK
jgi:Beta-lactamase enzyme family